MTSAVTQSAPLFAVLTVRGAMVSDVGRVRRENEDSVLYRIPRPTEPDMKRGMLALVADGMGGHAAGNIASQIAAQTVAHLFYTRRTPVPESLTQALIVANHLIHQRGQSEPDKAGMGTTCTVIAISEGMLWLAHVGDSRAYMVRDGMIQQISEDHSLVAAMVRDGRMSAEEAKVSDNRNVILRALGTQPTVEPFLLSDGIRLRPADRLVLCSDGLYDLVEDEKIRDVVTSLSPLEACHDLVNAALAAGGHDNVSVGVFVIEAAETPPSQTERPTRDVKCMPETETSA